jgi:hypothetical protein
MSMLKRLEKCSEQKTKTTEQKIKATKQKKFSEQKKKQSSSPGKKKQFFVPRQNKSFCRLFITFL